MLGRRSPDARGIPGELNPETRSRSEKVISSTLEQSAHAEDSALAAIEGCNEELVAELNKCAITYADPIGEGAVFGIDGWSVPSAATAHTIYGAVAEARGAAPPVWTSCCGLRADYA